MNRSFPGLYPGPAIRSSRSRQSLVVLGGALLALASGGLFAQEWPAKPLRIIVNVPPGGGIDQITRVAATRMAEALGQPVLVDNRGGAGGNIGVENVAKSPPDGYTLLAAIGSTIVMGPHLYKLNIDTGRDLLPIAPIARTLMFLVARNTLPVASVGELVAYAKANPGKLNYGSPGVGTGPHIATEMMLSAAKIQTTHKIGRASCRERV